MTLRYFGGMTVPEVAEALGGAGGTGERGWRPGPARAVGRAGGGGGDGGAGLATGSGLARRPARRRRRMTPERWRRIDELFDAAVRIDPGGREALLRAACGEDDDLRAEVGRLLAQDERADRD